MLTTAPKEPPTIQKPLSHRGCGQNGYVSPNIATSVTTSKPRSTTTEETADARGFPAPRASHSDLRMSPARPGRTLLTATAPTTHSAKRLSDTPEIGRAHV